MSESIHHQKNTRYHRHTRVQQCGHHSSLPAGSPAPTATAMEEGMRSARRRSRFRTWTWCNQHTGSGTDTYATKCPPKKKHTGKPTLSLHPGHPRQHRTHQQQQPPRSVPLPKVRPRPVGTQSGSRDEASQARGVCTQGLLVLRLLQSQGRLQAEVARQREAKRVHSA